MERSSQNHFFCLQEDNDKVEKVNIVIEDHIHFGNFSIAWKGLIVAIERYNSQAM